MGDDLFAKMTLFFERMAKLEQQHALMLAALEKIATMQASTTPGFIDVPVTLTFVQCEARKALHDVKELA